MTDTLSPTTATPETPLPTPAQVCDWLRTLSPAPRSPAPILHLSEEPRHGQLYLCSYSKGRALAFEGPPDYIARWTNWAVNTGVIPIGADAHFYHPRTHGSLAYVCPKSRRHVLRGLALQFRWEIIRDREVAPLVDQVVDEELGTREIVWNDRRINALALDRAHRFMRDHICTDCTVISRIRDAGEVYVIAGPGRAESRWGVGQD